MQEEHQSAPAIDDLIHDWIKNDPVLSKHIQIIPQPYGEHNTGFYIETMCPCAMTRYINVTLAWFTQNATTSHWPHLDKEPIPLNPADPGFFDKLRSLIKDAHNGSTQTTPKGNKWHTARMGCIENI